MNSATTKVVGVWQGFCLKDLRMNISRLYVEDMDVGGRGGDINPIV